MPKNPKSNKKINIVVPRKTLNSSNRFSLPQLAALVGLLIVVAIGIKIYSHAGTASSISVEAETLGSYVTPPDAVRRNYAVVIKDASASGSKALALRSYNPNYVPHLQYSFGVGAKAGQQLKLFDLIARSDCSAGGYVNATLKLTAGSQTISKQIAISNGFTDYQLTVPLPPTLSASDVIATTIIPNFPAPGAPGCRGALVLDKLTYIFDQPPHYADITVQLVDQNQTPIAGKEINVQPLASTNTGCMKSPGVAQNNITDQKGRVYYYHCPSAAPGNEPTGYRVYLSNLDVVSGTPAAKGSPILLSGDQAYTETYRVNIPVTTAPPPAPAPTPAPTPPPAQQYGEITIHLLKATTPIVGAEINVVPQSSLTQPCAQSTNKTDSTGTLRLSRCSVPTPNNANQYNIYVIGFQISSGSPLPYGKPIQVQANQTFDETYQIQ